MKCGPLQILALSLPLIDWQIYGGKLEAVEKVKVKNVIYGGVESIE